MYEKVNFLSIFCIFQASIFGMQNNQNNLSSQKLYAAYLITQKNTSRIIGAKLENINIDKFFATEGASEAALNQALQKYSPNLKPNQEINIHGIFYSRHPFKFIPRFNSYCLYESTNYLPITDRPDIEQAFIDRKQDSNNRFEQLMGLSLN